MTEQKNHTKNLKLYSKTAIGIATFIGGPLASGYLIRENFINLNENNKGNNALIIGAISTLVIFIGIFLIPEKIVDKIPNQIIPLIYTGLVYIILEKYQGKILNLHKELNNKFYSIWKAVFIGVLSLIIILVGIFSYIYLEADDDIYTRYDSDIQVFSRNEQESLVFYGLLDSNTNYSLIKELENITIPKWEENIKIIKEINTLDNLPDELLNQNKLLLKYSELRLETFKLFKKSIKEDTDEYDTQLNRLHNEIEIQLEKLNKL